jgi:hypothetical protein
MCPPEDVMKFGSLKRLELGCMCAKMNGLNNITKKFMLCFDGVI